MGGKSWNIWMKILEMFLPFYMEMSIPFSEIMWKYLVQSKLIAKASHKIMDTDATSGKKHQITSTGLGFNIKTIFSAIGIPNNKIR